MAKFYSGTATIDEHYFLRKADEEFYKYIGRDMYASVLEAIHKDDVEHFKDAIKEIEEKDMSRNMVSVRMSRNDGKYRWMSVELSAEPFDIDGVAMFCMKITDLAEAENRITELKRVNNENEAYFNMLNSILIEYDTAADELEIFQISAGRRNYVFKGNLEEWNQSMQPKVPDVFKDAFSNMMADISAGKKSFQYEIVINGFINSAGKDLCTFKCQTVRSSARSYKVLGCVLIEGKGREKSVLFGNNDNKDAGLDMLNKRAITEYAKRIIRSGANNKVYFIILDLDDFKRINDTYGHMAGDNVLITVSEVIKDAVGNYGVVGRIGGDEIFIVVDRISDHAELRNLLRTIRTNIEWAYKGKQEELSVTCSMGIAAYPDHGQGYDEVFALADRMLYRAKEKGKNRYVIYTPEIHDERIVKLRNENKEDWAKALREDRVGIMRRLIEDYLLKKSVTNEVMYSEIGYGFDIDEILVCYGKGTTIFQWTPNGVSSDRNIVNCVNPSKEFMDTADKDNLIVLNGMYNLEGKHEDIKKNLEEKGIQSAMFYRLQSSGEIPEYIMFARSSVRQKWSEYEITVMSIVGKVFEKAVSDR